MVALGIDIGGTEIAAGIVSSDGDLLHAVRAPTPALGGPEAVMAAVVRDGRRALSWAESMDLRVDICGVGAAGVIDSAGRVTEANDNLPGWAGADVRSALQSALSLPVVVINDVKAAAIGRLPSALQSASLTPSLSRLALALGPPSLATAKCWKEPTVPPARSRVSP